MTDTPDTPPELDVTHIGLQGSDRTMRGDDERSPSAERRHLLVFAGNTSWMYELPDRGTVTIGRAETCDLRIDDPGMSRQHARLTMSGDTVTLVDLGSQNGTQVNHHKLEGEHVLRPNDVVTIQKTTLLLHSSGPMTTSAVVLDEKAFRLRLEAEVDRAVRYQRMFSLICLIWNGPQKDRRTLERTVADQLRRIDVAAWTSETTMYVLVAEVSPETATTIAARVRSKLGETVQIGQTACPDDSYDVDDLMASAHNAAQGAGPGGIAGAAREYQTLTVGKQRVIVADAAMVRLYALVERLAPVDLPMLIIGETGCGKELVANAIHHLSRRRDKTLVSLNCAAIQETLVESELFGYEKGAFSGAVATKQGLLEAASGSTLFLDEIGELSLAIQAKLLRVLESQRLTRVGDVREREVNVRIVAATNRDLAREVEAGRFRQDLYFRLSAATLVLPPLRQRPRELPLLAAVFLDEACKKGNRSTMVISEGATAAMLEHTWPGNVRELRNLMQYVAAAHQVDVLTAEHVQERLSAGRAGTQSSPLGAGTPVGDSKFRPLADEIRELEITRIREALEAASNNQTRAAGLLAMPVRTFFEKAKTYGLTPKKSK